MQVRPVPRGKLAQVACPVCSASAHSALTRGLRLGARHPVRPGQSSAPRHGWCPAPCVQAPAPSPRHRAAGGRTRSPASASAWPVEMHSCGRVSHSVNQAAPSRCWRCRPACGHQRRQPDDLPRTGRPAPRARPGSAFAAWSRTRPRPRCADFADARTGSSGSDPRPSCQGWRPARAIQPAKATIPSRSLCQLAPDRPGPSAAASPARTCGPCGTHRRQRARRAGQRDLQHVRASARPAAHGGASSGRPQPATTAPKLVGVAAWP